jgi:hypothetical protein
MGRIDRWIRALIVANIALVLALLIVVVVDSLRSTAGHPAQDAAVASPSPSTLMPMGLAHIPTSNSCLLCHETGGEAGLKPVPAIGHPLDGWRECLVCHTNEKLGRTAPGHDGIPQEECLNCHKVAQAGPAITQPHSKLQDQHCLSCHGKVAHLPTSMVGRNEDECWLCHKPTTLPPPEYPHQADARLSCRECHKSQEVGNLPIDHALRADSTCLLCHEILTVGGSPAPSLPPLSASPAPSLPLPGNLPPPASPGPSGGTSSASGSSPGSPPPSAPPSSVAPASPAP